MRISETTTIEGARVARPIGRITAVSAWRAANRAETRDDLIRSLIVRADDLDADAIVEVAYVLEPMIRDGGIAMERTCACGIAVRLAA